MEMSKSKKVKESDRIYHEWQWIYENFPHFDSLLDVKSPVISGSVIGYNVGHFKPNNYSEVYNKTVEEELYSIYLFDESLINFYYIFDSSGKIVGHNLMYIPSPIDENGVISEEIAFSKFLRVDFDQKGYENIIHTQVHLHVSVYKTEFRVPLGHYLSPKEFLYIVLKYICHSKEPFVDKLLTSGKHDILLNTDEADKLRLLFGE